MSGEVAELAAGRFEVRFDALVREVHALAFPCADDGTVDLDAFNDSVRRSYLFARALIGHHYGTPRVCLRELR